MQTHKQKHWLLRCTCSLFIFKEDAPSPHPLESEIPMKERMKWKNSVFDLSSPINRTPSLLMHCSLPSSLPKASSSTLPRAHLILSSFTKEYCNELREIGSLLTARRFIISYPYHCDSFHFHQAIITSFKQCQTWELLRERNTQEQGRHLMPRTLITFW